MLKIKSKFLSKCASQQQESKKEAILLIYNFFSLMVLINLLLCKLH